MGYKRSCPIPQRMNTEGLRALMERALRAQGLRKKLDRKLIRRHEFKTNHGFRKFFQTNAESKMKSLHVKTMIGQDTGLAASYYKPTIQELLDEYLKAVDNLTINKSASQQQIEMIKNRQALAIEMQTKDREIHELKQQVEEIRLLCEDLIKRNTTVRNFAKDGVEIFDGFGNRISSPMTNR
jgi:hypothetical protein